MAYDPQTYNIPSSFAGWMEWAIESLKRWQLPQSVLSPVFNPQSIKQTNQNIKQTKKKTKVQFSNGAIMEFDGVPTEEDIAYFANTPEVVNWKPKSKQSPGYKEYVQYKMKEADKIVKERRAWVVSSIPQQLWNVASFITKASKYISPLGFLPWYRKQVDQASEYAQYLWEKGWEKIREGMLWSPEETKYTKQGEFVGEIAGSLIPWGILWKAAKGTIIASGLSNIPKVGGILPYVAGWATEGLTYDVMTTGEPWLGTAIGGAFPFLAPIAKSAWALTREVLWASTWTGWGVIWKAWEASTKWGKYLENFKKWLGSTAEDIVLEAREALDTVFSQRASEYTKALEKIKWSTKIYDLTPAKQEFVDLLNKFWVTRIEKWALDFSRSPWLQRYAWDVENMLNVMQNWWSKPWDLTLVWIDKLKQTIKQFYRWSQESRAFDKFVTELWNKIKSLWTDNSVYAKMLKDYEESSKFIKELQKWLSLWDKVQVDTAFRKLASVLRTNNEYRKELLKALDEASGGFLSSKIAGQQMSELLPRGLARPLSWILGGWATIIWWVSLLKLLPAAIFTSPRAVQALLRAIWLPLRLIRPLFEAISKHSWSLWEQFKKQKKWPPEPLMPWLNWATTTSPSPSGQSVIPIKSEILPKKQVEFPWKKVNTPIIPKKK